MWEIVVLGKPSNVNADRNKHWSGRAKMTKEMRETMGWLASAAKLPKGLNRIGVTVKHHTKTKRRVDACSCVESVKAGIDGMVDYGLIPDDHGEHLIWVKFEAPKYTGTDELVFIVEDLD